MNEEQINDLVTAAREAGFDSVVHDTHHPKRAELHFHLPADGFEGDPVAAVKEIVPANQVDHVHLVPIYPASLVRVVLVPDALPVEIIEEEA